MPAGSTNDIAENWNPARLLSTVGLKGDQEKERRATSALLAVMSAVPEFGHAIVRQFGAPIGRLQTYTEIQLKDDDGVLHVPDGAITVKRGNRTWCALVEVKTGSNPLIDDQVSRYLDQAKANGFDAVWTISNQITDDPKNPVVRVHRGKLKKVDLFHMSWWRILTAAIAQSRHKGVSDPDQAWVLNELITYLDNEKSGACGFQGMSDAWASVRDACVHGTLRRGDRGVEQVARRWEQFVDYLAMSVSQELGRSVTPVRPKDSVQDARVSETVKTLAETGQLRASLKIPDAVGHLSLVADLRTKQVTTSIALAAPKIGQPKTRINWALRQLKRAPNDLRIDVQFAHSRETSSLLLAEAREDPSMLLSATDRKREPRMFCLAMTRKMGLKRGTEQGSFARETRNQAMIFYRDLIQDLKSWQAPAPRISDDVVESDAPLQSHNTNGDVQPLSSPRPMSNPGAVEAAPGLRSFPPIASNGDAVDSKDDNVISRA